MENDGLDEVASVAMDWCCFDGCCVCMRGEREGAMRDGCEFENF